MRKDDDDLQLPDENNHLKGTEYAVIPSGENSPIRRGVVTIDGARLRFAVFPEKISRNGRPYHPVRFQYLSDSEFVLRAVRVDGKRDGCAK